MLLECRLALRRLRRTPVFAIGAILLLAVGLGATTALYSIAENVLLDPLPFPDANRLVRMLAIRPGASYSHWSEAEYLTVESRVSDLDGMAAYDEEDFNLVGPDGPVQVRGGAATANLSEVLGARPALGRFFSSEEDRPGGPTLLVLSHGLWRDAFGSDPAILGRTLRVDGVSCEVIGVLPPAFETLFPMIQVWKPRGLDRAVPKVDSGQYLQVIGRLRPTTTLSNLRLGLDRVAPELTTEGLTRFAGTRVAARPLRDDLVSSVRSEISALFAIVFVVLVAVCFNLAGILLARGTRQRSELSMRACLGAPRRRLVATAVAEAVLIAIAGVAGGLGLASLGVNVVRHGASELLPRAAELDLDGRAFLFGGGLGVLTVLISGLLPALNLLRGLDAGRLVRGVRGSTRGSRTPLRKVLVSAQLAVSAALLVCSGVLARSLARLGQVDLGFDHRQVTTFQVRLPQTLYPTSVATRGFVTDVLDALRAVPGVRAAAATNIVPMEEERATGFAWTAPESRDGILPAEAELRWVSPGYFETLGIPLGAGRGFDRSDAPSGSTVTVISRSLAETLWPGHEAVGRQWKLGRLVDANDPWLTVVGVVEDIRVDGPREPRKAVAYFPHAHLGAGREIRFAIAGSIPLPSLAHEARAIVGARDPTLPVDRVLTMTRLLERRTSLNRIGARLVGGFSALAMLLAALGLYGQIGYSVAERAKELGIRSALGATRGGLIGMVVREGLLLAGAGLAPGLAAGFALTALLRRLVVGVHLLDPPTTVVASATMLVAGIVASWIPARRAVGIEPAQVLRYS